MKCPKFQRLCGALLVMLMSSLVHAQTPEWRVRLSPAKEHLYSVTYGEGLYVAVGNHRTILTSRNAKSWTVRWRNTNSPGWLCGAAHGNGVFVAVGNGYQKYWPLSSPSTFGPPGSAGYSSDSNNAPIVVSKDGTSWMEVLRGKTSFSAVAFGRGRFVAVGLGGLIASGDGYSWFHPTNFYGMDGERLPINPASLAFYQLPPAPTQIAYGNGVFVIRSWRGAAMVSTNGLDWVRIAFARSFETTLNLVAFSGSRFVAPSEYGNEYYGTEQRNAVSRDGVNWSSADSPFYVWAIGRGHRQSVVAGGADKGGRLWVQTSPDGIHWPGEPTEVRRKPYGIGRGQRGVVLVGAEGLIMHSPLPKQ